MRSITLPIFKPKKIPGNNLRLKLTQKAADPSDAPISSLKGTASGSVGASALSTGPILASAKTKAGITGVTPKQNPMQ